MRGQDRADIFVFEEAHSVRAGGAEASKAPAGAYEAGARPEKTTAWEGVCLPHTTNGGLQVLT